ncbi:DUF4915 domain-containing protein [Litorivicinus sp.]|nr:DUF4915 domain-containing protein [Litorivicinus sp.]
MSNKELERFIKSLSEKDVLIYFGCGEIGARTAKRFGAPHWGVDNSPALWGGSYGDLKDIQSPESIRSVSSRVKVVVCSAAEGEIKKQLHELGVSAENIALSPYARSIAPAEKLYRLKIKVLLASGGPSSESPDSGGGLYMLSINGDSVSQTKLFGIASHGLVGLDSGNVIASSDAGLVCLCDQANSVLPYGSLPAGVRPHGIAWNGSTESLVVVANSHDSLITIDQNGEIINTRPVLRGTRNSGIAFHHINDVAYSSGALYLSMFSFTGSWKSGAYDGGIYAFDAENFEPLGPVVSGASLPHSVTFKDGDLWFCNSLPGLLTKGDKEFELAFPTFARGLDFQGNLAVVGASRNRNLRDNKLESGTQIREVNSGFYITLMDSGLSRFVALKGLVPEVHAVKIISVEQSNDE